MVDRAGKVSVASDRPRQYHSPRFAPDGRRVAVDLTEVGTGTYGVQDLEQGTLTRVTFEGGGHDPVWTPDGRRLCYGALHQGMVAAFCRNTDGTGEPELLHGARDAQVIPGAWLPGGRASTIRQGALLSDLWGG